MEKNQANAKQHPETEILLKENYSVSSFMLSSKTKIRYSKKCVKSKCVCFNKIMWLIITRLKMKNGSHTYEINRTRPRHGHRYTKYKMCLSIMMVMCNKQHLKLN